MILNACPLFFALLCQSVEESRSCDRWCPPSPVLIYKWSGACPHGLPAEDLRSTIVDMALRPACANFVSSRSRYSTYHLHRLSTPTLMPLSLRHPSRARVSIVMHSCSSLPNYRCFCADPAAFVGDIRHSLQPIQLHVSVCGCPSRSKRITHV